MLKKKKVIQLKLRGLQGILIKASDDQSIPVLRVPTGAAGAAAPCGCLEMQPQEKAELCLHVGAKWEPHACPVPEALSGGVQQVGWGHQQ